MRTDDVLAAVGLGLCEWRGTAGKVAVDGRAAHLLGLPGAGSYRSTALRSCLHAADYVSLAAAVELAAAEGTVADSLVRVVTDDGSVLRTVRVRIAPRDGVASGTMYEVRIPTHPGGEPTRDWRRAREAFLLDAGRALAEADSTEEVLRVAAGLSMPGFSPDGLAVFGVQQDRLTLIGHHGQEPLDDSFQDMPLATDYPAAVVARTGHAVYLPTRRSYEDRFPTAWPRVRPYGRSSWAYLPLVVSGTTIGAWMAAFRDPVEFTPDERSVLTTVARMLGQALARAGQHESERELADGLQRTMMPARKPGVDGMAVAARYIPTGGGLQVGGDWYDVIDLPSGRTAIVIGDVQGHDVRAAGLMGQLRIALRAYAAEGHGPDAVLSRASRFLYGLTSEPAAAGPSPGPAPGPPSGPASGPATLPTEDVTSPDVRFATCLYVEIDPLTGCLDVVRAGHTEPAVRLGDGTTLVRRTAVGLPLGIEPDTDYPTTRMTLEPGEVLLLCTDGLIETGGHDHESGWLRLSRALAAGPAEDLEVLADSLVDAVHGPASHQVTGPLTDRREDDIALVLLRRRPDGPTCAVPQRRTVMTVSQDDPGQIRAARDDIRALLHDWSAPDQVEHAALLVSEAVTNVLVHTDGDALLAARVTGMPGTRRLHVDVHDSSDDMPHRRSPGELASSGRGLMLMEELADAWGVDPRGEGKSTWFELHEAPVRGEEDG